MNLGLFLWWVCQAITAGSCLGTSGICRAPKKSSPGAAKRDAGWDLGAASVSLPLLTQRPFSRRLQDSSACGGMELP